MKTWKNSPQIEEFSLTALSCPYDQKLKIHVGNWTEELCYIYSVICLFDVHGWFIKILYSGAPEEGVTKGVVFNLKRSRIKIGPWHTSQRSYKRRSSDSTYFYQQPFLWGLLLLHNCTDVPLYDSAPENITFHGHVLPKRNKTPWGRP